MDLSRFLTTSTDPHLPPGVLILRTDTEQAFLGAHAAALQACIAARPDLAEDCRSIVESAPFIIRYAEAADPITCECCGTQVAAVPEKEGRDGPWKRAIWEPATGRKHTLRRCEWMRGPRP